MSAGPLAVPWLREHVPAMLQAWWPGEEGGHAIADVLLGEADPGGRLPYTVYASDAQVPPVDVYDISRGFTYMYVSGPPLYPFGHGLSYTRFALTDLKLSADTATVNSTLTVTVTLTNSGARAGSDVVQVYAKEPAGKVAKPRVRLVGFTRVELQAGARQTISIPVQIARMCYWDEIAHRFAADPGIYELRVGSSSDQLPVSAPFTLVASP